MTKELSLKNSIVKAEPIFNQIDCIVSECHPVIKSAGKSFADSMLIAKAISELRKIFDDPITKAAVEMLQDSKLGFLTDRPPEICARKKIQRYDYETVKRCCIQALLEEYKLTNNEFNIIAYNFYAAKNGRRRKIREIEGLTDFKYANSTPVIKTEDRMEQDKVVTIQYSLIECYATWKYYGKPMSIGIEPRDDLMFKIKVNEFMGDDALVGKALSKLFGRVLDRINGTISLDEVKEPDINGGVIDMTGVKVESIEIIDNNDDSVKALHEVKKELKPLTKEQLINNIIQLCQYDGILYESVEEKLGVKDLDELDEETLSALMAEWETQKLLFIEKKTGDQ